MVKPPNIRIQRRHFFAHHRDPRLRAQSPPRSAAKTPHDPPPAHAPPAPRTRPPAAAAPTPPAASPASAATAPCSRLSDFSEFEHTSSPKSAVWCAGVCRHRPHLVQQHLHARPAAIKAASGPASPPPITRIRINLDYKKRIPCKSWITLQATSRPHSGRTNPKTTWTNNVTSRNPKDNTPNER